MNTAPVASRAMWPAAALKALAILSAHDARVKAAFLEEFET